MEVLFVVIPSSLGLVFALCWAIMDTVVSEPSDREKTRRAKFLTEKRSKRLKQRNKKALESGEKRSEVEHEREREQEEEQKRLQEMEERRREYRKKRNTRLMEDLTSAKGLSLRFNVGEKGFFYSADMVPLTVFISTQVRLVPGKLMHNHLETGFNPHSNSDYGDIIQGVLAQLSADELDFLRSRLEAQDFAYFSDELSREMLNRLQNTCLTQGLIIVSLTVKVAQHDPSKFSRNPPSYEYSRKVQIDPVAMKGKKFSELIDTTPDIQIPEEYDADKIASFQNNIDTDGHSSSTVDSTKDSVSTDTHISPVNDGSKPSVALSAGSSSSMVVLSARLDELEDAWMKYELDPLMVLNYPLMADATCEETNAFIVAMSRVKTLSRLVEKDEQLVSEFSAALENAEVAFVKAEANAKKVRHAHLDDTQRKKVKDARALVAMLSDEEASPHERVSAYRKAGDFLEGILVLPDRPIMGLLTAAERHT